MGVPSLGKLPCDAWDVSKVVGLSAPSYWKFAIFGEDLRGHHGHAQSFASLIYLNTMP